MVLLAGSELFTGNCLLSIPLLEKEISVGGLLKNWIVVYFGNMVGGMLVAAGLAFSGQFNMFGGAMAVSVFSTAAAKCSLSFMDAFIKGIFCNVLVCLAVWMSFSAKDSAGKVLSLFFPILIFVVCGFEHCVANMYYIPAGIIAKSNEKYVQVAMDKYGITAEQLSELSWKNFFIDSSIPVTLGNIIGGMMLGVVLYLIYKKLPVNRKKA